MNRPSINKFEKIEQGEVKDMLLKCRNKTLQEKGVLQEDETAYVLFKGEGDFLCGKDVFSNNNDIIDNQLKTIRRRLFNHCSIIDNLEPLKDVLKDKKIKNIKIIGLSMGGVRAPAALNEVKDLITNDKEISFVAVDSPNYLSTHSDIFNLCNKQIKVCHVRLASDNHANNFHGRFSHPISQHNTFMTNQYHRHIDLYDELLDNSNKENHNNVPITSIKLEVPPRLLSHRTRSHEIGKR